MYNVLDVYYRIQDEVDSCHQNISTVPSVGGHFTILWYFQRGKKNENIQEEHLYTQKYLEFASFY